jgi:uncharacterized protein involved in exopolysaccharide biosynthesis
VRDPRPVTAAAPPSVSNDEELSLLRLANVLLRHRWLVLRWTLLVFAAVVGLTLVLPRTYTARSSFMPQARKPNSSLTGIAAQFGLVMPTADAAQSPAFYADLLTSRGILGSLMDSTFEFRTDEGTVQGSLADYYESKGATPALRRDAAIRELAEDIEATTVQKTGVVNLEVTMREPALALQVNRRLLDLLNQFNLRTRQSQAGEERRFTERRLAEVRQDVRAAEDRLQQFMQRNRDMRNSPELTFQADRLQREVMMQQQVYTTLAQAYEQAKIEEVRDTPVITQVEQPELPVRPDRRGLVVKGVLGLLVGLLIGSAFAFWKSYTANTAGLRTGEASEFATLRRQAAGEFRRPWQPVAHLLGFRRAPRPEP